MIVLHNFIIIIILNYFFNLITLQCLIIIIIVEPCYYCMRVNYTISRM